MTGRTRVVLPFLTLLVMSACTTVVMEPPGAAIGAQLSVERFLQAANQRDHQAMGRLFGTRDGAAIETGGTFGCAFKKIGSWFGGNACTKRRDVEVRMDAIASVLQHEDYRVVAEQRVPGRDTPTTRVMVNVTTSRGVMVRDVPFIVVQTSGGRWLIEQVDLQRVMAAR